MQGKFYLVFLIFMVFVSCKEKENKVEQITGPIKVEEKKSENNLYVIINAKILDDDVFEVYYYESGESTFNPKDFVSVKVNGSPDFQEIKIKLPDQIYPERLRLDMGKNKNQRAMTLNTVSLKWNDKVYDFKRNEIANEFKPSKFMDFDKNTFTLTTKVIDNRYDPYFYTMKLTNIVDYLLED